ncbi:glycosyltransferase [Marinicellulosiphila megalodicopiae]|uniref:glycosyltransferase n=1 Tax=Marinicellulosiphila megalodicopiae TaxID=2724896 RepID=UPI003BB11F72
METSNFEVKDDISTLRIMIFCDAALGRNGVGTYYQDFIQYIENHVDQITIIAPTIDQQGKWEGMALPLPGDHTQKFVIPNFRRVKKQIHDFQPDVIIAATPGLIGLTGAYFGNKMQIPVLAGFHTWFEKLADLYWGRIQGFINRLYFKLSNHFLFKWSDAVFANSDDMIDIVKSLGSKKEYLVGTPVAFDFLNEAINTPPKKIKRIMFAGRLAEEKNLDSIIESAHTHNDLEFNIYGDGPQRDKIEAAAKALPNLNYLGWVDRSELMQKIDNHDCVVLPSHVESFGTIALEAMARGKITIVSKNCGICQWPELVKGLYIIRKDHNLSDTLSEIKQQSTQSIEQKCHTSRDASIDLNQVSLDRWLTVLTQIRHAQ